MEKIKIIIEIEGTDKLLPELKKKQDTITDVFFVNNDGDTILNTSIKSAKVLDVLENAECFIINVEDFIKVAEDTWSYAINEFNEAESWTDIYDIKLFPEAIKTMVEESQVSGSISKDRIFHYLWSLCKHQ